ncbi:hypothetical protein BsWGS_14825 [Bradybaena similaris]
MCQSCVDIYLGTATSKKCPADEEDCEQVTRNNIFPDPGFRREMKQLLVYCVNEDCKDEIKLSVLEKHVKDCVHRKVQCINSPLGCREEIKFKDVEDHLKKCGYRPVICEQCGSEFSFNSKQEHDLEQCPEAVVTCAYLCGQEMKRRLLDDHKAVCPKKPAECQFKTLGCTFTGSSEEVKKHEKDVGSHFQVLLECFTAFRLQSLDMQKNLEDLRRHHEESKRATERIDSFVKTIHKDLKLKMVQQVERLIIAEQKMEEQIQTMTRTTEELQHVQQSIEQLKALIPQVASHDRQVASHEIRMAEMDLRFQMIETASYDGKLLWKIRDFSHRKRDAVQGRTVSLYSQPFYTSRFGYKMCGRVYLNGDGIGRGTHMSLYFVVMKGEYDALLQWPFQSRVSLILLDQSAEKRHLKDEFFPDPASTSFRRPVNAEMNVASGCPLFVAHTVLDNPNNHYVKDDMLFIKIVVDTSNIPAI